MRNLVFATQNEHKLSEVQYLLGSTARLISLSGLNYLTELAETHDTLEGNAKEKAVFIHQRFGQDCFAEDTGLEVDALKGAPGVYSARYAGEGKNAADNIVLLLRNMQGVENREACFRTVICLILDGREHFFTGRVSGMIALNPRGDSGFGYDPVFIPQGSTLTFAEMDFAAKNGNSHRMHAFAGMKAFLETTTSL